MASIDRDYVLGVAVQLQTESVAEFEAQVKRQLESIKPVKVKVLALTPEENSELRRMLAEQQAIIDSADSKRKSSTESMLTNWKQRTVGLKAQSEEETAIIERMQREQQSILDSNRQKQVSGNQEILDGWKQRTTGIQSQLEAENAIIARLTSEQNAILAENAARNATSISDMRKGFAGNTIGMTDPGAWEADMRDKIATAKMLKQEMNDLGGPVNFAENYGISTSELKDHLNFVEQYAGKVQQLPSYWDHTFTSFKNHLGQWTLMTASITAAYVALEQFQHMYQEISEFQVQGVLFQANQRSAALQGIPTDGTTTQELLSSSIQLATKWGDKVNDVAQDLSLWYKRTGDLNSAMYLTNQALEFQLTTGTDLEDVYKTLTGLSVQAQGQKMGGIFGDAKFDLSETKNVLHEIFAAAVAAGGGMRQISASEKEIGGNSNSAALLLDAIDKDNAALKMLGSTMTDSIALNAALIQSFGNTGASASEAGEKIGRIAGSLASLSVPNALDKFKKAGMDVSELSSALDNHKNVLFAVLDLYGKMDKEYGSNGEQFQMMMSHILGGTRQFEAVQAIYEAYKENLKQIKSAMRDLSQEDQVAAQMHDTLRNETDRATAGFESLGMAVGLGVMPALQSMVGYIASTVVPEISNLVLSIEQGMNQLGGLMNYYHMYGGAYHGIASIFGLVSPMAVPAIVTGNGGAYYRHQFGAIGEGFSTSYHGALDVLKGQAQNAGSGDEFQKYVMSGPVWAKEHGRQVEYSSKAAYYMLGHPSSVPIDFSKVIQSVGYDNLMPLLNLQNAGSAFNVAGDYLKTKAAQDALMKKIADEQNQGNFGGGAGGSTTSKPSEALKAESDSILRYLMVLTKKDEADQRDVATAKLQVQHTNNKAVALENLRNAYKREIADRQNDVNAVQKEAAHYTNLANKATNPGQQQEFLNKANQLQSSVQVLQAQITYLKAAKQIDVNDELGKIIAGQYAPAMAATKEAMKNMSEGMKLKTETIPDLQALHASLNENLYLANRLVTTFSHLGDAKDAEKFRAWAATISSDLSTVDNNMDSIRQKASSLVESLSQETTSGEEDLLFPGDKAVSRYGKAMDQIKRKLLEYQKLESEDPGDAALQNSVNQWYAVQTAIVATSYAVDAYQEKLKALQNTPTYAAITALGNDVGNTLTSDVMSAFTSSDNNQVNAIQSQIVTLQNEKNLLQGKNNEIERMMLEQRISQLEKDKAGIEERMRHPGFLKGIEEDMAKAVMKGLTDRLTKDLQDAFVNSILGPNPQNNPVVISSNANTQATQQNTVALSQLTSQLGYSASGVGGGSFSIPGISGGGGFASTLVSLGGGGGSSSFALPGVSIPGSTIPGISSGGAFTGGSVPSFSNGAYTGGTGAGAYSAVSLGESTFPFFGSATGNGFGVDPSVYSQSVSSGAGAWSGGIKTANGKINVGGIMQALGGVSAAVQGYDQGGFAGSLEAGLGVYSALTSSVFSGGMAAFLGSVAPYAAAAMFLASLFHPHYNSSQNPDMFGDSGYAQGLANAQGISQTQANGTVYEDPGLKQQLGGMTELQYLDAWYNSYPGGKGLNPQGKQLWDEIGRITGNGKGLEVRGLHQGNVYVSLPGQDSQVGESGNWQTVLQDIGSATQQLYALENQDMAGKGTWISVNSYGAGGGGSSDFSPWYSPGLNSSDISSVLAMPYPPLNSNGSVTTSPGDPSGGTGGGSGPILGGGGGGVSPMNVHTAVYLNTDVIAQQVNAFNIQRQTSGWAANY